MSPRPDVAPVTIRLSGVSVRTNHGVTAAEREVGQRMVFDLELRLTGCDAVESDELDGTVDYGAVADALVESATSRSYLTLERLTAAIGESVLDGFPAVGSVTVRATKPEPPVPVVMDGASVELTLSRSTS